MFFKKYRTVFTDAFLSCDLVDVSQLFNKVDSAHVQILCQGELIKIRRIIITETKLRKTKHTFSTMVVFLHERLH